MKLPGTLIIYGIISTSLIIWSLWGKNGEKIEIFHFYYLLSAAVIWAFSFRFFGGRFVRPKWKQPGKFIAYMTISFVLLTLVGHYALIFIIGHQALGGIGHYMICKKHNINFWTCQPEEKYLEVTEKWAKGDFTKIKKKNVL
jgi:hypothetical protein